MISQEPTPEPTRLVDWMKEGSGWDTRPVSPLETMGLLAGVMAHEVNNMLGIMLGYSALMLKHLPPGEAHTDMEELSRAGLRARDQVAQFFAFRRLIGQQTTPWPLAPLLKGFVQFLRGVLPANMETLLRLEAQTAQVLSDPTQIHQLLIHLSRVVLHAMAGRGGCLTVVLEACSEEMTRVYPLPSGPCLLLTVIGVPSADGSPSESLPDGWDQSSGTVGPLAELSLLVERMGGLLSVPDRQKEAYALHVYLPRFQESPRHPS